LGDYEQRMARHRRCLPLGVDHDNFYMEDAELLAEAARELTKKSVAKSSARNMRSSSPYDPLMSTRSLVFDGSLAKITQRSWNFQAASQEQSGRPRIPPAYPAISSLTRARSKIGVGALDGTPRSAADRA